MPYKPSTLPVLGLLASARGQGDTGGLLREVLARIPGAGLIDVAACQIAPYAYEERYGQDDFAAIAEAMLRAETIIFASPVYWYSMSAPMKLFFDRLTDLTGSQKTIGKALAGKRAFVVASGGAPAAPASFEPPFADTARYFNMDYGGMLYAQRGEPASFALDAFVRKITKEKEKHYA